MSDPAICNLCGDTGYRNSGVSSGIRRVVRCECFLRKRSAQLIANAGIPRRYESADFANYDCSGPRECFAKTRVWAKGFVDNFPLDGERGIVFVGNVGTGKTHLSVSLLKELAMRGLGGGFRCYSELLQDIRDSYSPRSESTQANLLLPLSTIPVLILDDIGVSRPSEWVLETVALILDRRYNAELTTILTTNFPLEAQRPGGETLQERVGARVVSRLREMCRFVEMYGPDHRLTFQQKNPGPTLVA